MPSTETPWKRQILVIIAQCWSQLPVCKLVISLKTKHDITIQRPWHTICKQSIKSSSWKPDDILIGERKLFQVLKIKETNVGLTLLMLSAIQLKAQLIESSISALY